MDAGGLLAVALGAALADNLVLTRLVGMCPLVSAPPRLRSAVSLGLALILAIAMASVASVALDRYVLVPLDLGWLRTLALVFVVVASAVVTVRVVGHSRVRLLDAAGRPQVGLVGNCAVLAVALLAVEKQYGLVETLVYALAAGLGLLLVTVVMSGLRGRIELGQVPESLRGLPIGLVTGGLAALAFMGFLGMGSQ